MRAFLFVLAATAAGAFQQPQGGIVVPLRPPPATDAERLIGKITGTVAAVSGKDVHIDIRDGFVPRIGDRVELYENGAGGAPFAGWWSVTYAEGDIVQAQVEREVEPPARGMKALVYSGLSCCLKVPFDLALGVPEDPRITAQDDLTARSRLHDIEERARKAFEEGQRSLAAGRYSAAVPELRQAAELSHENAAYELFRMFAANQAGGPDRDEAAKWLRRAAELGQVEAQRDLGFAFEGRLGVMPKSPEKAQAWLRKAAAGGSLEAAQALRPKR